jgi:hypothetical protein
MEDNIRKMQTLRVDKKKRAKPVASADIRLVLDFLNQEPKRISNSESGWLYHQGTVAIRQELRIALGMMLQPTVFVPREWTPKERKEWTKLWESHPEAVPELGRIRLAALLTRYAKPRWRVVEGSVVHQDFRSSILQAVARLCETREIHSIEPCAVCDKFFLESRSQKKACSEGCQKTYASWRATDYQARDRDNKATANERENEERETLQKIIEKLNSPKAYDLFGYGVSKGYKRKHELLVLAQRGSLSEFQKQCSEKEWQRLSTLISEIG